MTLVAASLLTAACTTSVETTPATTAAGGSGTAGSGGAGTGGAGGSATSTGSGGTAATYHCSDAPPAGAAAPPPLPAYSGGSCPMLAPGVNSMMSDGDNREFILVLPSDMQPDERLPIVFLWHWLGGDADSFLQEGDVQGAADAFRVIAVIPEKSGNAQFTWPMDTLSSNSLVEKDLTFFDDMLSCVADQYDANTSCVSSAGVSAGALWTSAVLASQRGEYLSSFISLSGGTGGYIKPWEGNAKKIPAMVLWGGSSDTCIIIDFEDTSKDLESNLAADGHFFVECIHNCGHSAPPLEDASSLSKLDAMWDFVLDHPYWVEGGTSAYQSNGLPVSFPEWCGIGSESATPRVGECTGASGC